jgi:hypothetical protein
MVQIAKEKGIKNSAQEQKALQNLLTYPKFD